MFLVWPLRGIYGDVEMDTIVRAFTCCKYVVYEVFNKTILEDGPWDFDVEVVEVYRRHRSWPYW